MSNPIALLVSGLEFALAARQYVARDSRKRDRSLSDEVCLALRTLYFTPGGVLSFLREVHAGRPVSAEQIQTALANFNDRQWQVEEALSTIDFKRLGQELGLNIKTAKTLDYVRRGKKNLRRDIQNEINYYGQRGVKVKRDRLAKLISSIEKLNDEIENVEVLANRRARE